MKCIIIGFLLFSSSVFGSNQISLVDPTSPLDPVIDGAPTHYPVKEYYKEISVLKINNYSIIVEKPVSLSLAVAGLDYSLNSPIPLDLIDVKILVLGNKVRIPIRIVKAIKGTDYNWNETQYDYRETLVWKVNSLQRYLLEDFDSIEQINPELDYPYGKPRGFYIIGFKGQERVQIIDPRLN
jgi:hypothetical protein